MNPGEEYRKGESQNHRISRKHSRIPGIHLKIYLHLENKDQSDRFLIPSLVRRAITARSNKSYLSAAGDDAFFHLEMDRSFLL
jgi:hypothetical protein